MPVDKEKRRAYENAYWKETRAWRREHHICTHCGKRDAAYGFVQCPECQQKLADYQEQYRERKVICDRQRREERRKNGLCPKCGKPIDGTHALCESCHKKKRIRDRRRQIRMRVNKIHIDGFCVYCGEEAVPGKRLCKRHYDSACANLVKARASRKALSDHPWKRSNDICFAKKAR